MRNNYLLGNQRTKISGGLNCSEKLGRVCTSEYSVLIIILKMKKFSNNSLVFQLAMPEFC